MAKKHANGAGASSSADPAASSSSASPPHSASSDASTARSRREAQAAHVRALDAALDRPGGVDLPALRALSLHGFVNDGRRRRVWPLLLGVDVAELDAQAAAAARAIAAASSSAAATALPAPLNYFSGLLSRYSAAPASASAAVAAASAAALPAAHDYYSGLIYRHKYFDQIEKDIARSLCHFEGNRGWKEHKRSDARLALARLMHTLFSLHSDLHYVQGFHDIASVFLMVCNEPLDASDPFGTRSNARGEELAFMLTERLALLHLRDSLRPTLDTVVEVMSLIFPLLAEADPEVFAFLRRTQVQSFFSLSWILTWFSHNLSREADVARVFDYFLSSHPLQPVYATVALIVQMRAGLLQLESKAVEQARARWEEEHAAPATEPAAIDDNAATDDGLRKRNNQGTSGEEGEAAAAATNGDSASSSHDSAASSASAASSTAATATSPPPPFDPSSITVEMSAVHAYFQHLPPVLNLDELFARTSALALANPPKALLRSGGGLAIPSDSPLLLDEPAADLPRKLTNYLEWKRRTKRVNNTRQMPAQTAVASAGKAAATSSASSSSAAPVDASSPMGHDALGRHIGPLDSAGLPLYPASAPSPTEGGLGLIDPTKVASSFYAYPSANSSRAALIRFAIMGRARMLRERAANAWRNRGKPKPRVRGQQAGRKSWLVLPRLTRKGRFAVAGVLFAVATVMLAMYLPAASVLQGVLRPAAQTTEGGGVHPHMPEMLFAVPPVASAGASSSASAVPVPAAAVSVSAASSVAAGVD